MYRLIVVNFLLTLISVLPALATHYGRDDQIRDQQQLVADEEAVARLQDYLYANQPNEVRNESYGWALN